MENLEYWTKFAMDLIRKEKINKPSAIKKIIEIDEFKNSGVSENELSDSMAEEFKKERQLITDSAREKLNKLRNNT